jgi:electron transport complex protein RnfG
MAALRRNPLFQAVLLGLFALVAAAALATGDWGTHEEILMRQQEDLKASLVQVIPHDMHDNDLLKDTLTIEGPEGVPVTIYRARKAGHITGVAYRVAGNGYGGEISLIMGVAPSGELLGVRVISHFETPGLGDKIEERKSGWILGFAGLSLTSPPAEQWAVKKDGGHFDQFSGATITPRGVVKAVKQGLEFFAEKREAILAEPETAKEEMAGGKLEPAEAEDPPEEPETKPAANSKPAAEVKPEAESEPQADTRPTEGRQ